METGIGALILSVEGMIAAGEPSLNAAVVPGARSRDRYDPACAQVPSPRRFRQRDKAL